MRKLKNGAAKKPKKGQNRAGKPIWSFFKLTFPGKELLYRLGLNKAKEALTPHLYSDYIFNI